MNAASEFERRGEVKLAEWTRQAVAVAKLPMFMRSEEDVRDDGERPIEFYMGYVKTFLIDDLKKFHSKKTFFNK